MKTIDDLFDWVTNKDPILDDIFAELTYHDRLICKEVCKRWYNLIMERAIFWKIPLLIKPSEIEVQNSVLKDKQFKIVTFGFHDGQYIGINQFFDQFGSSIEKFNYLDVQYLPEKYFFFFTKMPALKILNFPLSNLTFVEIFFSTIMKNNPYFEYQHLEQIIVQSLEPFETALNNIKTIKQCIPEDCEINALEVTVDSRDKFKYFLEVMKIIHKINNINIKGIEESDIEKLLAVDNINCDVFTVDGTSLKNPYSALEAIQKKHRNLRKIKLDCDHLPKIAIDLPRMTELSLQLSASVASLKPLEQLKNLKFLRIKFDGECGFGHEPITISKLKNLDITLLSYCNECLHALSNSFGNLKILNFKTVSLTCNDFKRLICNWKNLANIFLEVLFLKNQRENFSLLIKPKIHVRSFCIIKTRDLTMEILKEFSKLFPNLQELKIATLQTVFMVKFPNIVKEVLSDFKNITSYQFAPARTYVQFYEVIYNYLESIGFSLKEKASFVPGERLNRGEGYLFQLKIDREKMTARIFLEKKSKK